MVEPGQRATRDRSGRWTFTVNNPGEWRPPLDVVPIRGREEPAYMIWQLERGAEGTPHIQGYVRFYVDRTMSVVKRFLNNDGAHLEHARGNEKQNHDYCSKEDTRVEGEEPHELGVYDEKAGTQGRRSDLEEIAEKILTGTPLRQVAKEHPVDYIRYHGGVDALFYLNQEPSMEPREITVWWLWGPTGVGKTHRARTQFPSIFEIQPGRDPFSGYRGQPEVLFDEFNEQRWTLQEMNKYLDKWPCKLDCRYRDSYAAWTLVVICANQPPDGCYAGALHALRMAFLRRVQHVVEIKTQEDNVAILRNSQMDQPAAASQ